jgi:hypothetical protein
MNASEMASGGMIHILSLIMTDSGIRVILRAFMTSTI